MSKFFFFAAVAVVGGAKIKKVVFLDEKKVVGADSSTSLNDFGFVSRHFVDQGMNTR